MTIRNGNGNNLHHSQKEDNKVLNERAEKYGDPKDAFEAYGAMCEIMHRFSLTSPNPNSLAHISALRMVLLKILRAVYTPSHSDNYIDARNYLTIAELCVSGDSNKLDPKRRDVK